MNYSMKIRGYCYYYNNHNKIQGLVKYMSQTQAVIIAKGQSAKLERASNMTTGYTWDILLSPGLILENEGYSPSAAAQQGAIGAGGMQVWQIKAVQEGIQYIILWNHRRWEQDDLQNAEVIKLQVSK